MNKIETDIKNLTRKNPFWGKLFLYWYQNNPSSFILEEIEMGFSDLIKHKQLLSKDITIDLAKTFEQQSQLRNITVTEYFNDQVQFILKQKKKNNFIKSLQTKKYQHLFNEQIYQEIGLILDKKISSLIK